MFQYFTSISSPCWLHQRYQKWWASQWVPGPQQSLASPTGISPTEHLSLTGLQRPTEHFLALGMGSIAFISLLPCQAFWSSWPASQLTHHSSATRGSTSSWRWRGGPNQDSGAASRVMLSKSRVTLKEHERELTISHWISCCVPFLPPCYQICNTPVKVINLLAFQERFASLGIPSGICSALAYPNAHLFTTILIIRTLH